MIHAFLSHILRTETQNYFDSVLLQVCAGSVNAARHNHLDRQVFINAVLASFATHA